MNDVFARVGHHRPRHEIADPGYRSGPDPLSRPRPGFAEACVTRPGKPPRYTVIPHPDASSPSATRRTRHLPRGGATPHAVAG